MIKWSDELLLGEPVIDLQHKEIVNMLNTFLQTGSVEKEETEIYNLIKNLEEYAEKHFDYEEKFMIKEEFSGIHDHKLEHNKIAKDIESQKQIIFSRGISKSMIDDLAEWFEECLSHHLISTDQIFRDYIISKRNNR